MSVPKTGGIIRVNPFDRQWEDVGADVIAAVERVGKSGRYILGPEVAAFESKLARFVEAKHAVGCASGLDAIEIGLRALGLRRGEEVLTTPLSAFATTLAIIRAGGAPVFVDTDETGLLDLERARQCLEERPALRFFVPVHLFGQSLDLGRLQALKDEHGLQVVEDCAQALGASWCDRQVGGVGQVAALSLYPTKNLGALGDAGAVFTNDDGLADEARCLRDYGQRQKNDHDRLGLNSRLDEVQAAILHGALLPRLEPWTERRRNIATRYLTGLSHALVQPLRSAEHSRSVWHLFPVVIEGDHRDRFCTYLSDHAIQVSVHYPQLIPTQSAMRHAPHGYRVFGDLRVARRIAAREVTLPIHPYLEDRDVDRVVEIVNHWVA